MSMTKRYLESLPEEEQNAILGDVDSDHEGEWDDSWWCGDCGKLTPNNELHNGICADCCFKRPNYWERSELGTRGSGSDAAA